ncbi:MAG TPA: 4-hydroxy-tetrahydrodipicolinate reductase, partial [Chthoniobacterales bacterium]
MEALRVLLVGAAGRMGQAITRAAETRNDLAIVARIEREDSIEEAVANCDVAIDFSHADATERNCAACMANQKPLVIGTTGHAAEQTRAIRVASTAIPVLLAANFSVGVNTLFWLTRKAAELLGDGFDLEIVETHHRLKKDAPSGTAKRLAEILCEVRGLNYDADVAHGRQGLIGERPAAQIGMHAIRAGDVVGDHTVIFGTPGERLELTHKASSRETFASGA